MAKPYDDRSARYDELVRLIVACGQRELGRKALSCGVLSTWAAGNYSATTHDCLHAVLWLARLQVTYVVGCTASCHSPASLHERQLVPVQVEVGHWQPAEQQRRPRLSPLGSRRAPREPLSE